jgi:hypothetical protein
MEELYNIPGTVVEGTRDSTGVGIFSADNVPILETYSRKVLRMD